MMGSVGTLKVYVLESKIKEWLSWKGSSGKAPFLQKKEKNMAAWLNCILNKHNNRIISFRPRCRRKHSVILTSKWLKKGKIKVLEWPSQSPDHNTPETLWLKVNCAWMTAVEHKNNAKQCCKEENPPKRCKRLHQKIVIVANVDSTCYWIIESTYFVSSGFWMKRGKLHIKI